MQRVKRSTSVAVMPAPPAGGTPGFFAAPNPQGGQQATVPGYEWYNGIQEELMAVIEGAGLTGSESDHTKLRQAIAKMIQGGQRSVVVDSATFAPAVAGTGKAVYWDSANGRFDLALSDGTVKQNMVGFADVANSKVYVFGDAVLFASLTPGSRYYLDAATPGAITTVAPANGVVVGIARAVTELFVDIDGLGVQANQNNTFTKAQRGAYSVLTDGATITPDFNADNMFRVQLSGNRTLANPTNLVAGQSGCIDVYQDSTGFRTLAYQWGWQFPGAVVPVLSTAARAKGKLLYSVDVYSQSTVTISIATPGVVTWENHGLTAGQQIQLTTTGALPTGLSASTTYFVIPVDANSFQLAATQNGTAIATSGSQSGVHTCTAISITGNLLKGVA